MVAANVTPCSTLTSMRSIPARSTTTAGNHIESHTQTIESCLKLIFGRVLIATTSPSPKNRSFEARVRVERFDYSGHSRNCWKVMSSPRETLPDDETKGVRNQVRKM